MNKIPTKKDIKIIVQVLDKQYILENFNYNCIPDLLKKWELGGLTDPLGQLIEWLWEQISDALSTVQNAVLNTFKNYFGTFPTDLPNLAKFLGKIKDIVETIEDFFGTFPTDLPNIASFLGKIKDLISGVVDTAGSILDEVKNFASTLSDGIDSISSLISDVSTLVTNISDTVENFLKNYFGEFGETLAKGLDTITTTLTTKMDEFSNYIHDFETDLANFSDQIGAFGQTLASQFATWSTQLTSATETLLKSFDELGTAVSASISAGFNKFISDFSEYWKKVQNFFRDAYNELANSVNNVRYVLQGFVNSLGNIYGLLHDFTETITNFPKLFGWIVYSIHRQVIPAMYGFASVAWGVMSGAFNAVKKAITWAGTSIIKWGNSAVQGMTKTLLDISGDISKWVGEQIVNLVKDPIEEMGKFWLQEVKTGVEKGTSGEFLVFAKSFPLLVGSLIGSRILAGLVGAIGRTFSEAEITIGIPGTNIRFPFKWGWFISEMGKVLWDIPNELLRGIFYGYSIWITRPLTRGMNALVRNQLPVELPTLDMLTEITRRTLPTKEIGKFLSTIRNTMALYGFSDFVISWYIRGAGDWYISVKDRFGMERKIPLALIYTMPSASDFCRMMLKDIFEKPEDFFKAMLARGMIPDVASMYYLLHYKYPSLEKLFTFICRISAGMGWVTAKPEKLTTTFMGKTIEIGFSGMSPKELSDRYATKGVQAVTELLEKLLPYAKWQDYAPFAWIENFTADRLIVLDLMADIPTRIDARWMYKWGVISDEDLMRVVLARGMHPNWVESITIGEAMNALTEERTIARTPIMNALATGALTPDGFKKLLGNLTTVKILDKDVTVKFLEGEIKLLEIRALYDRAVDVVKDVFRYASRSFVDNIITFEKIGNLLESTVKNLSNTLKITLEFDKTFLEQVKPYLELQYEREVVERIRYWIRYMLYQILYRIQTGYLPWSEVENLINDLAKQSKMTDSEKAVLLDVAKFMYSIFTRKTRIDAILNRVSRGVIDKAKAVEEIKKLGLSEDDAKALIEKESAIYRLTISQLVTFSEYIPVDPKYFNTKLDLLGVPTPERKLWRAYSFARVMDEHLKALYREYEKDFTEGEMSETEFKSKLDQLATLWGNVKRMLGVDWILWSPEERKLMLQIAKEKRERILRRKRKSS